MRSLATSTCNHPRKTDKSSQSNWSIRQKAKCASLNSSRETTEHCCKLHSMVITGILTACFPRFFTSSETREVAGAKFNTHGETMTLPHYSTIWCVGCDCHLATKHWCVGIATGENTRAIRNSVDIRSFDRDINILHLGTPLLEHRKAWRWTVQRLPEYVAKCRCQSELG